MRKNKFLLMILLIFTTIFTLSSCQGQKDEGPVKAGAIFEETVEDGKTSVEYIAQVTNLTIYNFENVTFKIELYNGDTFVALLKEAKEGVDIDHNNNVQVNETFEKTQDFDSIRVTVLGYDQVGFLDTYMVYIIALPIATIVLALCVIFFLIKNKYSINTNAKISSVIILICFVILIMGPSIGWIPIIFLDSSIIIIFLSGVITYKLITKNLKPITSEDNNVVDCEEIEEIKSDESIEEENKQ